MIKRITIFNKKIISIISLVLISLGVVLSYSSTPLKVKADSYNSDTIGPTIEVNYSALTVNDITNNKYYTVPTNYDSFVSGGCYLKGQNNIFSNAYDGGVYYIRLGCTNFSNYTQYDEYYTSQPYFVGGTQSPQYINLYIGYYIHNSIPATFQIDSYNLSSYNSNSMINLLNEHGIQIAFYGKVSTLGNYRVWRYYYDGISRNVSQIYFNGYRLTISNQNIYDTKEWNYNKGIKDGIAEVQTNPQYYDLYNESQYLNYGSSKYNQGKQDGLNTTNIGFVGVFSAVFGGLSNILNVEIWPGITLGIMLGFPLMLLLLVIILYLVKG